MDISARQKLANLVRNHRGGRSYRSYGKLIGVSGTTIQDWENLATVPSRENLTSIARTVGYTLQELVEAVEGRNHPNPTPIDRLIRQVESLPPQELTLVVQAGVRRLSENAILQKG
jgi:transcriptional regulator with XRE-family HTH domain